MIKDNLVEQFEFPANKIQVFPNGVDLNRFFPRDKHKMRTKFKLSRKDFIVSFVGHFDARKGPLRVLEAIEGLEGVSGVFVGSGLQKPIGPKVSFVVPYLMKIFLRFFLLLTSLFCLHWQKDRAMRSLKRLHAESPL